MKKKPSLPPIPPLSLEVLGEVEDIERYARTSLYNCGDYRYYNAEKAVRILRTCVVTALVTQFAYYESLPSYHPQWRREITERTINAAIGLVGTAGAEHWDFFHEEMRRTVKEHRVAEAQAAKQRAKKAASPAQGRVSLRDSYLASFPEVKILDICWAAEQRYREWKRWLKHELKDGSTPDRAFREVLTSGKRPTELRDKPRPSGWQ